MCATRWAMSSSSIASIGRIAGSLLFLLFPASASMAQRPGPSEPGILRVCADPDNLPNSNQAGEGFENKLAELLAQSWNSKLEYVWWAAPRGLFSHALNGHYCDVVIVAPSEMDMATVTKAYFRTGYVMMYRKDSGLNISSLDDPALKTLRIGVHLFSTDGVNTPPAMALSAHGVVGNLVGFGTTYIGGRDRPEDIIQAVIDRKIDLAMVWGPLAGFFARNSEVPLVMVPIPDDSVSGIPFSFSVAMAAPRRDRVLRDSLQKFLDDKAPAIQSILAEFKVPLFPAAPDSARR